MIEGTDTEKVSFATEEKSAGKWNGIEIEQGGSFEAVNCIIENAHHPVNIAKNVTPVIINRCQIDKNITLASTAQVTDSRIYGHLVLDDGDKTISFPIMLSKITN